LEKAGASEKAELYLAGADTGVGCGEGDLLFIIQRAMSSI
jgi:hypothetical protein